MSVREKYFVAVLCALLSACTLFPEAKLDEPMAEVTLDGALNAVAVDGRTVYWGKVRNTGSVNVENVVFVIEVFGASGSYLGKFSGIVSQGLAEEEPVTTLDAGANGPGTGETGDFTVDTTVPWGAAGRTEYHAEFTEVVVEGK